MILLYLVAIFFFQTNEYSFKRGHYDDQINFSREPIVSTSYRHEFLFWYIDSVQNLRERGNKCVELFETRVLEIQGWVNNYSQLFMKLNIWKMIIKII